MAEGDSGLINQGKKNLLGIGISAVDYEFAACEIVDRAKAGSRCATTALAVHGIITGALDRTHRYRLNEFDLVTPDGQPVRWALNLLYRSGLTDRVYGPTLTLRVCERAAREGVPIYLYGSGKEVVSRLALNLIERFPGLVVAGTEPSRFRQLTADEQQETVDRIRRSGAKILFVGLGCPRQEVFTYEMSQYLSMPVIAVGAAFDYHSGNLREPPMLFQRFGLQWLYRLVQDPRRLWKRYLFTNSQFVALFLAQWLHVWHPTLIDNDRPATDMRFG
jgi:N-acetylglucosaminyldiphosphoundecaprenol N-acetyl-beta-D-mannosaminyltransferase